jgi:DEAD/DEAH box helicase domain-containing protein
VRKLDLENHIAHLVPVGLDYFTEAQQESEIQITTLNEQRAARGCEKGYGEIQVTTQVVGFRKIRWFTNENLGQEPLDLPPSELQTTGYWVVLSEAALSRLREAGLWTNDPNDYGPNWQKVRLAVRKRDQFKCQVCGAAETKGEHDVHHKIPFRAFLHGSATSPDVAMQSRETLHSVQDAREQANRLENLTTLCPSCHRKVEQNVRIRSGLTGLGFVLGNLAPLFLMCDTGDLGIFSEPAWSAVNGQPSVVLYDLIPAGIGFSEKLFELHDELIRRAYELVSGCGCEDGCPSCVGPGGENGYGGKAETLAILEELLK